MQNDQFYQNILDRLAAGVYFVDRNRIISYWSKGAEKLSGFSAEEVVGKKCAEFLNHVDEMGTVLCGSHCPLLATIQDGQQRKAEVWMMHKFGQRVPVLVEAVPIEDETGKISGVAEIFHDISSLKFANERIRELSNTANLDALTQSYNRRGLEFLLAEMLNDFHKYDQSFGVIFIDVDKFKSVNDLYGHLIGDQVLIGIVQKLKNALRETDIIGRWGGDEFVVFIRSVNSTSIQSVVSKISNVINADFIQTDNGPLKITCSLGFVLPDINEDMNSLIRRADEAMYEAKNRKSS